MLYGGTGNDVFGIETRALKHVVCKWKIAQDKMSVTFCILHVSTLKYIHTREQQLSTQ